MMNNFQYKSEINCLQSSISTPQVTVVVVPRERFSHTHPALESIYQNTQIPFSLIYVDGNSPSLLQEI